MQFIRVYLLADGNMKRGAITNEKGIVPDPISLVWFNPENGIVLHEQAGHIKAFSYFNIPGNESFRVVFFDNHFEYKSFDEIIKKEFKNDQTSKRKARG